MRFPAPRASAMLLAALLLVPWPFQGTGGIEASTFGGGARELVISFPPGGGTNTSVNLTLPSGASVLSAVMDITGLPLVTRGSLDYSAPAKLGSAPSSLNLTLDGQGAHLASFNWSAVQATDQDFRTDEGENISVDAGVHMSDAITGGTSFSFPVISGISLDGNPRVNCTPDGEILVAWLEQNISAPGNWSARFQRFSGNGTRIGPTIQRDGGDNGAWDWPCAVSDSSGRAVLVYEYSPYPHSGQEPHSIYVAIFNSDGTLAVPDFIGAKGSNFVYTSIGSAVVTGPDEMLVSWFRPLVNNQVSGRWFHLNGTPIGDQFTIDSDASGGLGTGIVSVGPDHSIVRANFNFSEDGHTQAYIVRSDRYGYKLHPKVFVGANDSTTTPTSQAVLDDGTSVVAYTADYPGRDLEVHCARLAPNGTILGQFMIANTTETDCFAPSLCTLAGNRFACAWGSSSGGTDIDLQGRVFRADGTPEGAPFSMGKAYGANASWELCARGNSSLALVVRSDAASYGAIRVEVVELQRALKGHIDSPVLDRPGTVVADVRLSANTTYSIDVLDARYNVLTASGLQNGDPVRNWSPYYLRLNLERAAFNESISEPAVLQFGVSTRICDFFEDRGHIGYGNNIEFADGRATLNGTVTGSIESDRMYHPYKAVSLDNLSWAADKGITPSLQSHWTSWSDWETSYVNPDTELVPPPGDSVRWKLDFLSPNRTRLVAESIALSYSLLHKTGLLQSAPVNLTDGSFSRYRVNWASTGEGTVSSLVTTDGGMTYYPASNGIWQAAASSGRALQAMLVLEGDGNLSPVLSGFSVDYEAQSLPSGLELELDRSYRWSPPEGSDLESGVQVRDFSSPLNAVLARNRGGGDIAIPLNISSATAGLLRLSSLRLVLNMRPVIESFSPQDDVMLEQGAGQRFSVAASDPDADPLQIDWSVDGQVAGTGQSFDYTAPDSPGNHTVTATVSDGKTSVSRSWNVTVIFVDRNGLPVIQNRLPASDPVINETETVKFSVLASDPEGRPLRYSWFVDGEKVSASDNHTWRTWYNSSGAHPVSVAVSDGEKAVSASWNLTVLNTNRPPVITGWQPDKPLARRPGASIVFHVNASDPDDDAVNISWLVDGKQARDAASPDFTLVAIWPDGTSHMVRAVASDGNLSASHDWVVRIIQPNGDSGLKVSDPACLATVLVLVCVIAAGALVGARKRGAGRSGPPPKKAG